MALTPAQPLASRTFGTGPRKVLALHCTIAHAGAWRALANAMADEITLIAPDMLSHGKSPDWDKKGDFQDRMVKAVEPFLDEPMDVVGHSFGATVALRLAVDYPDKVRSLTMIEPVYFAIAAQDAPDILREQTAKAKPFHDAVTAGEYENAARIFNRSWSDADGPRWPDLPEATRTAMTRGVQIVPACSPSIIDDCHGLLKPGVLDRVAMPVLLLRGDQTDEIIGIVNDGLARRLPDADNQVIAGAGHMLPITNPVETAAALRSVFVRAPLTP
ncbi:alpha/beta fold hydrolase [Arenibacterium sp. CAU 1754]